MEFFLNKKHVRKVRTKFIFLRINNIRNNTVCVQHSRVCNTEYYILKHCNDIHTIKINSYEYNYFYSETLMSQNGELIAL